MGASEGLEIRLSSIRRRPAASLAALAAFVGCLWGPAPARCNEGDPQPAVVNNTFTLGKTLSINPTALPPVTVRNIEITEAHFAPPADWERVRDRVLTDTRPMIALLDQELKKLRARLGTALPDYLTRNEARWSLPGIRGELNQVDLRPILRIIHEKTQISLLVIPSDITDDSAHLRQLVARQHIDSGDADPRGRKPGRDTVIVRRLGQHIVALEYRSRPVPGSPQWWADYWHATFKTPKMGDYAMATYCAGMQMAAAACVAGLRVLLDENNASFETAPMLLSGLFAAVIGTLATTYRVWTYRGSETSKLAKLSSVSLLYAYSLMFVRDGTGWVFNISDPCGLLLHTTILWNTLLNQKGRLAWQKLAEIRDKLRYSAGHYDLAPWIERAVPELGMTLRDEHGNSLATVSRATFFNQTLYLIPFSFKLIGLIGVGAAFHLPLLGWKVDTGPLLLVASIPAALYVVTHYAGWVSRRLNSEIIDYQQQLANAPESEKEELEHLIEEREYSKKMILSIEDELKTEHRKLWADYLLKPHRLLKTISATLTSSLDELRSTWLPVTLTTGRSFFSRCSDWLSKKQR